MFSIALNRTQAYFRNHRRWQQVAQTWPYLRCAGMDESWYRDGLRFTCTQCGNCCSGAPGYVWVTQEERRQIAEFLGIELAELERLYVRRVGVRHSLIENAGASGDCVFLREQGGKRVCGIYPVRPRQCRTWPFWTSNLRSAEAWGKAARECPGMNHGRHHGFVAVEDVRLSNTWEGAA